ncbi:hypothetical protein LCGC14_0758960 [marine sediment metagenome]|uniref:J domain-containing protein n=1 Tax=marine sediment metagenome TaxID=412755 RepID=A0A0F9QLN3_9ZZZZ
MKDPYKTLGVKKDADAGEIKKAYRDLAKQTHPDKNPDDPKSEDKFKEVSAAYELLNDAEKRQQYDLYGEGGPQSQYQPGSGFPGGYDPFANMGGFGRRSVRGSDAHKSIRISFMDAAHGCVKKISIDYPYECNTCKGNGSKDGTKIRPCNMCGGAGKVGYNQGFMQILQTCHECQGQGHIVIEKCTDCFGHGIKTRNEILKVTVPAGLDDGMTMRLTGKGMPSPYGAESGDMYLTVLIASHPKFKRNGIHVYSEKTIGYIDAILGVKIPVETIHGQVKLKIPAGTQPETILKIKHKGVSGRVDNGNHMVCIKVSLPKEISEKEKDILEKLRSIKI